MKKEIISNIKKMKFKLNKKSPEILIVAGTIGVVVSAVMACRATTKLNGILEKSKQDIQTIHECSEREELKEQYSQNDAKKDLTIIYTQTGIRLVKLYAPSILLGTLSISGILASNNILRKRNVALATAYATVDKGFKEYRSRVVERFGQEVDKELKYDIKAKKIEETIADDSGKEKKVKKTVNVVGIDGYSDYARFFDESSRNWENNPEYNLMFLRAQQNYANDKLKADGFLFLNDVYEMLDIPKTKAGQMVGWVYNKDNAVGDNYVDFGIFDVYRETNRDFVNGYENVILLDFNVDGNILDLI